MLSEGSKDWLLGNSDALRNNWASEFWGAQHAIKELSDLKGLFGSVWDSTGKSGSWISVHLIVVYLEY